MCLPRWDEGARNNRDENLRRIHEWVRAEPLRRLVADFGGVLPDDPDDAFPFLDEFSAARWDFRQGRERNLAAGVLYEPAREASIISWARQLGLSQHPARRERYHTVLMTGGMVRAGISKPLYVRLMMDEGLRADRVVFLGGFRPFGGDEHHVARALGVPGDDEFDAMVEGMRRAFELGEPDRMREHAASTRNGSWARWDWHRDGTEFSVVAAPSADPIRRRANTVDTYRFWAERVRPAEENTALVVTAPIYVPYQGAGAVQVLGLEYGIGVETVGISRHTGDLGEYAQVATAHHHLQEMRSAIRGMMSLREALQKM